MHIAIVSIIAFFAATGCVWLRLDDLADRVGEARPGGRVRRALIRQMGALVGWWLVGVALALVGLRAAAPLYAPFLALGLLLIVSAIVAKRRGDAPLFWAAS